MSLIRTRVPYQLYDQVRQEIQDVQERLEKITGFKCKLNPKFFAEKCLPDENLRRLVCEEFQVTWEEIEGQSRERRISDARAVYSYCAYILMRQSLLYVSGTIKRHHASVLVGCNKIQSLLFVKDPITEKFNRIESQLKLQNDPI